MDEFFWKLDCMRSCRLRIRGETAFYHCMTRTVNGEALFNRREKEVLRKMIRQVADFSGIRVLTHCVMSNHFHVLLEVPFVESVSDVELLRRYRVLYPKPTRYESASIKVLQREMTVDGEEAAALRARLLSRMGNVSEFMKTLKQRFSIWFNKSHARFGTLWAERFKSVLVEGKGNPLQTMAAYIDLNPVRAGLVEDPKDYRFCGYAEAVAGIREATDGLLRIWGNHLGGDQSEKSILSAHRSLLFGQGADPWLMGSRAFDRETALRVIEEENGVLSIAAAMRCRVRYFSDGLVLGSAEFVRGLAAKVQHLGERKYPPKAKLMVGAKWGDLAVIRGMRQDIFS